MKIFRNAIYLAGIILLLGLSSCATLPPGSPGGHSLVYFVDTGSDLLRRHAPVFVIEDPAEDYNRIGTPVAVNYEDHHVAIDTDRATVYFSVRHFTTENDRYTNLFYRVHFSKVPFGFVPFYLGSGNNVGLMIVVTLNGSDEPVLFTSVHTCGCYLSFIPTSHLSRDKWPEGWEVEERQTVFNENLPAYLKYSSDKKGGELAMVQLRSATHRVKNFWLATADEMSTFNSASAELQPFESLENLILPNGETVSFFETTGSRKGYVKGSQKIWERLLISWWAFDWRVGEDKKLGRDLSDGNVFYTSLKPWAREASDLRDFAGFLQYWGWRL